MEHRDTNGGALASQAARTCTALALVLLSSYVLNSALFPPIASIMPIAREISTYGGVAFSIAVAVVAWQRPSLMNEAVWSAVVFATSIASAALLSWGTVANNTLAILLGSPLGDIAGIWLSVLVGSALASLENRQAIIATPAAFLISYGARVGLMVTGVCLSVPVASALFIAMLIASYVLVRPIARTTLCGIHDSVAPTVLNVTSPSSYLPFSSFIYTAILLFAIACGFSVSGEVQEMMPATVLLSFLPVTITFVIIVVRGLFSSDSLYATAVLLVFAGFLTAPLALFENDMLGRQANAALFNGGSDLFTMLLYCLVGAVGARNKLGAASMAASAFAVQWIGIGIGAPIAQTVAAASANNPAAAAWATMAIAFVFVAFNYVGNGRFSFTQMINSIQPAHTDPATLYEPTSEESGHGDFAERHVEKNLDEQVAGNASATISADLLGGNPSIAAWNSDEAFAQASAQVAKRFGLTTRETEVFELLARGRTSPVIQEKLVLSHNTVKTHVRHIYAKLDVHSQQELISLVENEPIGPHCSEKDTARQEKRP